MIPEELLEEFGETSNAEADGEAVAVKNYFYEVPMDDDEPGIVEIGPYLVRSFPPHTVQKPSESHPSITGPFGQSFRTILYRKKEA